MSHITLDEMMPLLTREASARCGTLLSIFVGISVLFLIIGMVWQKKFTSYVQLYVDDSNIVAHDDLQLLRLFGRFKGDARLIEIPIV